jgi:putative sterol carrier protein
MSGIAKDMKSKLIGYLITKGIERINQKPDVIKAIRDEMKGEDRTMSLVIKGFDVKGFGIEHGIVAEYDEIQNPTVVVTVSEDIFIQLVRGKITLRESFFYGDCDISGENWLRELVIFDKLFTEFRSLAEEFGL